MKTFTKLKQCSPLLLLLGILVIGMMFAPSSMLAQTQRNPVLEFCTGVN